MLTLNQVSLSRGNKLLLDKANVSLFEKQKVGLVGHNGCGKSSFFSLILGQLPVDSGECQLNSHLRISHLSQQSPDSDEVAVNYVLSGDDEYQALQSKLQTAEQTGDDKTILACHDRLTQTGGYSKPAQAAAIMAGLGFSTKEQQAPVNSFSGGWRMRLSLARCLIKPADLLLLDEPTNHLDMEAIYWLERWLKQSPATVILISHDRDFLDAFVTHILHVADQKMTLYTGNYSRFEQTRAENLALQQATYEKHKKKIVHMMAFVNRFKAKASKAKQAQSRLKAVAKLDTVAQAQVDSPFSFEFFPCPRAGKPLIRCDEATIGYHPDKPILKKINMSLNPGDRFALLGPNGEGKSTFIKALIGELSPINGEIARSPHLEVGYFAQHQLEQLDDSLSPVQTIQQLTPTATEQAIRNFLGGFNFIGDMALSSIKHFSGGEKARLALAKLVWLKPNILLLDEPTNHLDLGMRSAVEIALQSYEGALILISHDRHFLRMTVDDFYLVYNGQVTEFDGDIDDYYQWLQSKNSSQPSSQPSGNNQHREKKNLQNRMKKLDQLNETYQKKMAEIETKLAEPSLYDESNKKKLSDLISERETIQTAQNETEEEWLEIAERLEKS